MPPTQSEVDFLLFRDTLTKLERLVDVWGNLSIMGHIATTTVKGIMYMLDVLTESDMNTCESNAIEELERLAVMKGKTALTTQISNLIEIPREFVISKLHSGQIFDKMIDSKIGFIKKGSFDQRFSRGCVEPMAALERLNEVQKKLLSESMNDLLESKIKEVVYTPIPKASPRNDHVIR